MGYIHVSQGPLITGHLTAANKRDGLKLMRQLGSIIQTLFQASLNGRQMETGALTNSKLTRQLTV